MASPLKSTLEFNGNYKHERRRQSLDPSVLLRKSGQRSPTEKSGGSPEFRKCLSPGVNEFRKTNWQPQADRRNSFNMTSLRPPPVPVCVRRSTCPTDELQEKHKEFLDNRIVKSASDSNTDHTDGALERFQKYVELLGITTTFFKVKPWNSDESLNPDGRRKSNVTSSPSSLRASPLMTRKDLDNNKFIIPSSPSMQRVTSPHADSPTFGSIDVDHYYSTEEVQELQEVGTQLRLGEVNFCMGYNERDEKLKFVLKSVSILLKPSPAVVGRNWICETITLIEQVGSKKKPFEIYYGQEVIMDVKKADVETKTIKLTVYDIRRRHAKNPVGHLLFPLREAQHLNKMNIHSKKLNFHSQPAGFNRGNIDISLSWSISVQKLEVKVGDITNLRCPTYGVDRHEFYMKITAFILDTKYRSYKTSVVRATPEITLQEKFTISMTSPQLRDSTILFQVYLRNPNKKKMGQKVIVGQTVIGPYMRHPDRTLSQWEKMITNPLEEITENHILYL